MPRKHASPGRAERNAVENARLARVTGAEPAELVAAALAFGNGGVKAVIHFAGQQAAKLPAVTAGKRSHYHLVRSARAGDEVLGVKARIGSDYRIKPGGDCRSVLGDILPTFGWGSRGFRGTG